MNFELDTKDSRGNDELKYSPVQKVIGL